MAKRECWSAALDRYAYVLNNPLRYTDPIGHFIPVAVAALFTAGVLRYVVAAFIVVSFVSAVITCSQDPGCSSVLPGFANRLNSGAISVREFLGRCNVTCLSRRVRSRQGNEPSGTI